MDPWTKPVEASGDGPELLLAVERDPGSAALHEQLELRLREQIRTGRLAPGSRLPSSRTLARTLGVSRAVVLEAYGQLGAEGYLTASQGAPTRVAHAPSAERPPVSAGPRRSRHAHDLSPGRPDLAAFPRQSWGRSLRAALREARFDELETGDPRGAPELRNELMRYLGRVRGAVPEPEHTLIVTGFTQGFALLCRTLADRGVERIALEDPGWPLHRLIAERAGLDVVGVAVDRHGLDVAALAGADCEVAVVTPAHQAPSGSVLAPERRAELLEWAEDGDGLIVEDDYDSELRYDRVAIGALQGLAPERVCQIGSFSQRLAPALRLGWVLSPSWLTGALTFEKALADGGSPALQQLALAEFIARGELDRHLRRMRLRYRSRRAALIDAFAQALPEAVPVGVEAGLQVLFELPADTDEAALLSAAAAAGVVLDGLARYRLPGSEHARRPGLVVGFGNIPEPAIRRAVQRLVRALRSAGAGAQIGRRTPTSSRWLSSSSGSS